MPTHTCEALPPCPVVGAARRMLDLPVDALNLSIRSRAGLSHRGVVRIGDLVVRSSAEVLKFPFIGIKSLREIEGALVRVGLHLDINVGAWPGRSEALRDSQVRRPERTSGNVRDSGASCGWNAHPVATPIPDTRGCLPTTWRARVPLEAIYWLGRNASSLPSSAKYTPRLSRLFLRSAAASSVRASRLMTPTAR